MSSKDYRAEFRLGDSSRLVNAVNELDAYISRDENERGVVKKINRNVTEGIQPDVAESLTKLRTALKRDKIEKEKAYEYLKKSNKTMKKIIEKLQDEMKICRDNIREEFANFENLNTERLLSINPKHFVTSTPRGKNPNVLLYETE